MSGPDATAYPAGFHPRLVTSMSLTSVKTATWCWAKVEHPDLRWHAKHHLDVVESSRPSRRSRMLRDMARRLR